MTEQLALPMSHPTVAGKVVVASVSGGRDSAAMSLHLTELGIEHVRVFADTGWEHPATLEYLRGPLTEKLGPIHEVRAAMDFVQLIRHKGLFPSRVMRFCTTELKVFPLQRFVLKLQDQHGETVNAVGIRRAESRARAEMAEWEYSKPFDCWIWRPLVKWSAADVDAIHRRHGLAMNPLYGWGARRVGCWPCIHERKDGIKLVADKDPGRLVYVGELEAELTDRGKTFDESRGLSPVPRTMFSYGGGGRKHVPIPIHAAVDWARSNRGEWHPGDSDGCARYGMCETDD